MSSSYIGPNFINAFLNKYGTSIEINFDSDLGNIPLESSFDLKVNGIVRNFSSITKIKNTLFLNPEISISNTDTIILSTQMRRREMIMKQYKIKVVMIPNQ